MKQLFIFIAITLISFGSAIVHPLNAQNSNEMSYQAVVRDFDDNLVANEQVGMQISILQGAANGTEVYVEQHSPTTNANGLVTLMIGNGTVISGDYGSIDWSDGPYFIKSETDIYGGNDYTISGTSPLLSVPYSLHAKTADSVTGVIEEFDPIYIESPAAGITTDDIANWNQKLDVEIDPYFVSSVAAGITVADTTNWGHHTDSTDIANMGFTSLTSISQNSSGQITISDTGGITPDPAAMLDLQSNTGGFLLPRMTFTEMFAIPNPPTGLLVLESNTGAIFVRTSTNVWASVTNDDLLEINRLNDAHSNQTYNSYYIGSGAGSGFSQSANFTTAVGADAGSGFGEGDFNTAIGAETGPASGTTDLHHTTTLGYNAKAEFPFQVVLGTTDDTVVIPKTMRIKPHTGAPGGYLGQLYVEQADSSLYYHDGNDWNEMNKSYKVGDFAFGGVIYYVDESGKHGLVCNLVDPSTSIRWSESTDNVTYARGNGIYSGEMNTSVALAALGIKAENSAILTSASWRTTTPFTTNYGDWYLPSMEELELMYANKSAINATISAEGWGSAIGNGTYWSSTEHHQTVSNAYVVDFSNGTASSMTKETLNYMRPIRRF